MQASAGFLERERLKQILDPIDVAICLIAAAAHDVDHPGKSRLVNLAPSCNYYFIFLENLYLGFFFYMLKKILLLAETKGISSD